MKSVVGKGMRQSGELSEDKQWRVFLGKRKSTLPCSRERLVLDIFENPYGDPRPTESDNPPATKKENPKNPKTPIIPKSRRSFPKSRRSFPKRGGGNSYLEIERGWRVSEEGRRGGAHRGWKGVAGRGGGWGLNIFFGAEMSTKS